MSMNIYITLILMYLYIHAVLHDVTCILTLIVNWDNKPTYNWGQGQRRR